MKALPYFQGTGRRKTSIARVRLVPGEGAVVVNGKALDDYFARDGATEQALLPFSVTSTTRRFNAMIKVEGGGVSGQIGAIAQGRSPDARPARQGAEETRSQARPKGAPVHEALARRRARSAN
jgi:ribosomal protein S9